MHAITKRYVVRTNGWVEQFSELRFAEGHARLNAPAQIYRAEDVAQILTYYDGPTVQQITLHARPDLRWGAAPIASF
jgi:hypothetical protein